MLRFLSVLLLISSAAQAETVVFNRDIRPILSDKCFHCHGFDEKNRKAGLRLDLHAEALKPAESGAMAIVPGKPEQSELLSRVLTTNEDDLMPPVKMHKPVTKAEAELIKQWIAEGAEYQGHWAFEPVAASKAKSIDELLEARLKKEGLGFSAKADAETLIRRVTLDLTGLPPTPEQVTRHAKDFTEASLVRLVDELLQSPSYGEHMAREWLDFARFADSNGFQTDSSRSMWPWRDWVISAFNANEPFDQFTIEQIAGDLLPQPTQAQMIATGFNRNHRINGEGGIIDEEWRIENIIDRVETTSFTWLGLTMNCARCHDHKYDPITQKDFYSFFAFFNNIEERGSIQGASNRSGGNSLPIMSVTTPEQEKRIAALKVEITAAEKVARESRKDLPTLMAAWEKEGAMKMQEQKSAWTMMEPVQVVSKLDDKGAKLVRQPDGSYLASGPNPAKDTYIFDAAMPKDGVSGFLLECFPDASLPEQSLGRNSNGNFVLTDFDVYVQKAGGKPEKLTVTKVEADYNQKGYEITNVIKKGKGRGWAIDGPTKKENRRAMFLLDRLVSPSAGAQVLLRLRHEAIGYHNIGRFRISSTSLPANAVKLQGNADLSRIKAILAEAVEKRSAAQKKELEAYYLATVSSPVKLAEDALAAKTKALMDFETALPTSMVMKESSKTRDAFVLNRGEYDKPGEKVGMAVPSWLHAMPKGAPMNRLGLAKWLVSTDNPLTARVWVNRQWERLFGVGLCKTTENFGFQAEYPVHPELLDWLAAEFMKSGWDMKHLIKLMVTSRAYQQSTRVTAALLERDPDNRLLARGPRFRLSGEVVRDQALAIGGLLVPKVGGPSVRPYMPEGVWDETSKYGDLRGYKADAGEGLYRKTMYTIWKRTAAPPTMMLFDAPTREICTVKRSRTNTPLQALAMLNEVAFVEAQRGLAELMMKQADTAEKRLAYGYLRATGRTIDSQTQGILLSGLHERLEWFASHPDEAQKAIAQGASKADPKLDPVELAAYTTTAGVLMNLDRVVTRD
ncbi:PSD1 and planctomycete cytochrome C domain-containing protein [Brevifollis gellanilyticus]|uniref:PSD1 and planctomycete cytochrome C domain-containing protein n=1 Tax=Brevifollis gellanilyticus TaxID=748831 RepID=UPI001C3FB337|nr:PSD1 and planctomycete cytochrome C domain-containing protein [Brevifollis gellanilyticus]